MLRLSLIGLLPVLGLSIAASAFAKEPWERAWIEVRTTHFVIASAASQEQTVALATDLENFRSSAALFTSIGRFEERIPTKIFLLASRERDLGFERPIGGYFRSGMRDNHAVMVASGAFNDEILKHEYIHFLVHNRDSLIYPTWFDEGFAELLSTLRVRGDVIAYGKPMDARISWLLNANWLPMTTVISLRDTGSLGRDRMAMYYAQAWLLVHYLVIEHGNFAARFTEFLRLNEAGAPPLDAFGTAFELNPRVLGTTLQRYLGKLKYYRGKLRTPYPPVEAKVRAIPRDEIAAALGTVALHASGAESARRFFEAALATNPDHCAALVGAGDVRKFSGDWDAAPAYYERAIALEPDNPYHELDYAEYFLDRAHATEEPARARELLLEARRHFARSYKLDPDNPETLAMNGATYLAAGEDAAKGVESLALAHELLPSQSQIRVMLARAYIAAGRPADARKQLQTLLAWSHAEGVAGLQDLLEAADEAARGQASPAEGDRADELQRE